MDKENDLDLTHLPDTGFDTTNLLKVIRGSEKKPDDEWKTFVLRFGKHKGDTMYSVLINDYQYIEWLDNRMLDKYTRAAVDSAIKYHYKHFKAEEEL